mmetsp:Transcript_35966/g.110816  ORF Transcript_35966/g.110816 Transcript_35966/m.110816 type:complete len:328 (+) Transcript_35966:1412-2395(+)
MSAARSSSALAASMSVSTCSRGIAARRSTSARRFTWLRAMLVRAKVMLRRTPFVWSLRWRPAMRRSSVGTSADGAPPRASKSSGDPRPTVLVTCSNNSASACASAWLVAVSPCSLSSGAIVRVAAGACSTRVMPCGVLVHTTAKMTCAARRTISAVSGVCGKRDSASRTPLAKEKESSTPCRPCRCCSDASWRMKSSTASAIEMIFPFGIVAKKCGSLATLATSRSQLKRAVAVTLFTGKCCATRPSIDRSSAASSTGLVCTQLRACIAGRPPTSFVRATSCKSFSPASAALGAASDASLASPKASSSHASASALLFACSAPAFLPF